MTRRTVELHSVERAVPAFADKLEPRVILKVIRRISA
jgi:hypothetical protein